MWYQSLFIGIILSLQTQKISAAAPFESIPCELKLVVVAYIAYPRKLPSALSTCRSFALTNQEHYTIVKDFYERLFKFELEDFFNISMKEDPLSPLVAIFSSPTEKDIFLLFHKGPAKQAELCKNIVNSNYLHSESCPVHPNKEETQNIFHKKIMLLFEVLTEINHDNSLQKLWKNTIWNPKLNCSDKCFRNHVAVLGELIINNINKANR